MLASMAALEFPRRNLASLQDLAARLLDSRKAGTDHTGLARDLLVGFYHLCMRAGLDRLLVELEQVSPPLDIEDSSGLSDHPTLLPALVAQLRATQLDGGGPRNAKPGMLVDSVLGALGMTLTDAAVPAITLDDRVRLDVTSALAGVADVELAVPRLRDTIIAKARERCEERYQRAFDTISARLDERGLRLTGTPKVPLDALHAVQRILFETQNAVISDVARAAIDRAKAVIERADPEAAARIDRPITHRLTPRDAAILRACDARASKQPAPFAATLLDGLTELVPIAWRAPERPVRPYAASQTFAVGDLIEHPKFGRGTVISCLAQRIEVEFADGKVTLVHVRAAT
jgi:hypothetical protein